MSGGSSLSAPRDSRLPIGALALAAFSLLFARRFAQLLHPQVWAEDGTIVEDVIASGAGALVHPLNGYLIVVPKLIALLALLFPLRDFATASTLLAWAFTIAVLVAIARAPIVLRGGPLLALAVLLVPSNPEVYGIALYTFWWAALLLFLAVLWRPDAGGLTWRVAFVVIGGLSSPIVMLVLPIALVRAFRFRTRVEAIVSSACLGCALIQGAFIQQFPTTPGVPLLERVIHAIGELAVFIGAYAIGNLEPSRDVTTPLRLLFTVIPLVLIGLAIRYEKKQRLVLGTLAYLWIGAIVFSSFRLAPPAIPDPVTAGPRYFFYPYLLESWILIGIALGARVAALRRCAVALLVLVAINVLPVLSREHDDLDWAGSVSRCATGPDTGVVLIPIETDGSAAHSWTVSLTGYACRQLGQYGLLGLAAHPATSASSAR